MIYRPKDRERAPRRFFSGVVREGIECDQVAVVKDARIEVKVDAVARRYVVEAAIPLVVLGLKPGAKLELTGDFGVTHSDKNGLDTALRTYWSNQATGIVNDEVFELKLEPKQWGTRHFEP